MATVRETLMEERKNLYGRIAEINKELENIEKQVLKENYKAALAALKDNYEIIGCDSLMIYCDEKCEDVEIFLEELVVALANKVKE